MTTALTLFAALALPALAQQQPARQSLGLPEAPSALPVKAADGDAAARKALHDAVFLPKTVLPSRTYSESQRLQKLDDTYEVVGHKDVTNLVTSPQGQSFDAMPLGAGAYSRTKTESVELSFLQPAPGVTVGVGYSEQKAWLGNYRAPNQTAAFAVLRITLGPAESKPTVFLPEARVSNRRDFQGEKVEHYSIDDLPSGLRP